MSLKQDLMMMDEKLMISQWNVHDLGDPNQVKCLKTWIRQTKKEKSILCLQELKVNRDKVKFHLDSIDPDVVKVIDALDGGRVSVAIMVPKEYQIGNQRSKGDGTFAWVQIKTCRGDLKIGFVYAPNEIAEWIRLWKWLTANREPEN